MLDHVQRSWKKIAKIFDRIDRHHEWGLRLTFDEKGAKEQIAGRPPRRTVPSGVDYLARKRDLLAVSRAQLAAARTAANRIYRALAREAADARRRTSLERAAPGSRLLLDAAFLVPAGRAASFRAALRKPGVDKNQVNLQLGIALAAAGDKAGAKAAFDAVGGNRTEVAKYWLAYLATKA